MRGSAAALVVLIALLGTTSTMSAQPVAKMEWSDLLSRPRPVASQHLSYGSDPNQVIDLWLPKSSGPHPVVVMIHGGCWLASVANHSIMDWAADDLAKRGLAVWNIEYRGVDQPGGGYPGTFQDVAAAIDKLSAEAGKRGLKPGPFVVLGHSAGGHLALWSAARSKLPKSSVLWSTHPTPIKAVVDLAGIANLQTDLDTACGADPVHAMTGQSTPARPDIYADTSPAALAPSGVLTWMIHGVEDDVVVPAIGDAYANLARKRGDHVEVLTPPGGHVEVVSPGTAAWAKIANLTVRLATDKP